MSLFECWYKWKWSLCINILKRTNYIFFWMRDIHIVFSFWITVIQDAFYGFIQNPKELSNCKKIYLKLGEKWNHIFGRNWKVGYLNRPSIFFTQMELKWFNQLRDQDYWNGTLPFAWLKCHLKIILNSVLIFDIFAHVCTVLCLCYYYLPTLIIAEDDRRCMYATMSLSFDTVINVISFISHVGRYIPTTSTYM